MLEGGELVLVELLVAVPVCVLEVDALELHVLNAPGTGVQEYRTKVEVSRKREF